MSALPVAKRRQNGIIPLGTHLCHSIIFRLHHAPSPGLMAVGGMGSNS